MRCLEIPARPCCQPQQRHCRSTLELVVLWEQLERPPRVGHSIGDMAQRLGLSGTVHGDGAWEMSKLHVVHDNHFRRWARRKLRLVCGWIQPALGGAQLFLDAIDLAFS